jgi:hypothetical protein
VKSQHLQIFTPRKSPLYAALAQLQKEAALAAALQKSQ